MIYDGFYPHTGFDPVWRRIKKMWESLVVTRHKWSFERVRHIDIINQVYDCTDICLVNPQTLTNDPGLGTRKNLVTVPTSLANNNYESYGNFRVKIRLNTPKVDAITTR